MVSDVPDVPVGEPSGPFATWVQTFRVPFAPEASVHANSSQLFVPMTLMACHAPQLPLPRSSQLFPVVVSFANRIWVGSVPDQPARSVTSSEPVVVAPPLMLKYRS